MFEPFSIQPLTMADIAELQEFEPAVRLKVRYLCDLGYNGAVEYLHSSLSVPGRDGAGDHRRAIASPIEIACVPSSPLSCSILITAAESWVRPEAEKRL